MWANESLLFLDVIRPPELLQFVDDVIPILHGERTFSSHHDSHGDLTKQKTLTCCKSSFYFMKKGEQRSPFCGECGIVFNRTRKPSGNRLNNGLVMPLLPLGIMPLVNTTTSNPRKETLLLGESSLKPSNEDLTQQMISNEKRLPTIYWKRYLGVA